ERRRPPVLVGPRERLVVVDAARAGEAMRLAQRPGVGEGIAAVDAERVVGGRRVDVPPAGAAGIARHGVAGAAGVQLDFAGVRRPDAELGHGSGTRRATGRARVRSASFGSAPVCVVPVSTSRQRVPGRWSVVVCQPPLPCRPAGSRVATVTACPRAKAMTWVFAGPSAVSGM